MSGMSTRLVSLSKQSTLWIAPGPPPAKLGMEPSHALSLPLYPHFAPSWPDSERALRPASRWTGGKHCLSTGSSRLVQLQVLALQKLKVTSRLRLKVHVSRVFWNPPAYQPGLAELLPLTSVPLARSASSPRRLSGHGISPSEGLVLSRLGDKALFPPGTVMRLRSTPHTAPAPGMIAIEGVDSLGHTSN